MTVPADNKTPNVGDPLEEPTSRAPDEPFAVPPEVQAERLERLSAFAFLTRREREDYIAIHRVFTSTILADLSAQDVQAQLARADKALPLETVMARLNALKDDGNLLPSSHTVKAANIRAYHIARSRYLLSKDGQLVSRLMEEFLSKHDKAREVSQELLAVLARDLEALAHDLRGGMTADEASSRVRTLFLQFNDFAESIREFYAYVGSVMTRYDLDAAAFSNLKAVLFDYLSSLIEEVNRHSPAVLRALDLLEHVLPELFSLLEGASSSLGKLSTAGAQIQESAGRNHSDWQQMRAWFDSSNGGSEVDALRDATRAAMATLLSNAKRMVRSSINEVSRRKDLLRFAALVDTCDPQGAHDLYTSAFGMYPSRHFADSTEESAAASTSWWNGPTADVPVSQRDRGTRSSIGRTPHAADHAATKAMLLAAADEQARQSEAAAAELRANGAHLERSKLSPAAMRLLQGLLTRATATMTPQRQQAVTADQDINLGLRLVRTVTDQKITSADGDLLLHRLHATVGEAALILQPEPADAADLARHA